MTTQRARIRTDPRVVRWWQSVGWGAVLLVVLTSSAWALIIFSRRFRTYLTRQKMPPTPSDDLWSMHKLPDETEPHDETDRDGGADKQET